MIGSDYFMTGMDSPVKIDSLTMAEPVSSTRSQGNTIDSGTLITSPGTRFSELVVSRSP